MICSYHTHTARCHHASGTDREYIEKAIAEGVKVLGFSDHAPMRYPEGYICDYKMLPEELSEYCDSLLALKEEYKDRIDIRIGLEAEYYPDLFEDSLRFWREYPIDYLILGQHYMGDERMLDRTIYKSEDKARLTEYIDVVCEGVRTGAFTYVAHADILNYTGDDEEFLRSEYRRLIKTIMDAGMPLEYNLLGMMEGRNYPNEIFWQEAAGLGAVTVIGCDAHSPKRVADKAEIARAEEFLRCVGVAVVDEIPLVFPFG